MRRRPPRSTRTDTLFPYTTLCRSEVLVLLWRRPGLLCGGFQSRLNGVAVGVVHGANPCCPRADPSSAHAARSEEHTSELQSLMRISYAVFCLKKKKHTVKATSKI